VKTRTATLSALSQQPELDVLIIGGGVNGIGTYRDLALQGLRVLLIDKADYCSGASAASSHMLHGGIRYLENGEFRLVREALHERNRLLKNAPHYAMPLPTTIPIFKWFSGFLNAPLKFLGLLDRPSERGAVVIKLGLMLYDLFAAAERSMPLHKVRLRKDALETFPYFDPNIVCAATYYDAAINAPERLCLEMLRDADAANPQALALNYAGLVGGSGDTVAILDEPSGETITVKPKVVVNAAGPWIDFANQSLKQPTRFIGGTKGSHIVVDHPQLYEATGGCEIFFENKDGRIVLIFPYLDRVLIGTTDIRWDDPDSVNCTDDEIVYMLDLVKKVFPTITVDRSHIVYQFSGVRPLPASDANRTGAISRDHSIQTTEPANGVTFPILSLIGGKWTTFRAFSEQAADAVLTRLGKPRKVDTAHLPIGGGKDYPEGDVARMKWLDDQYARTQLPHPRIHQLFVRYGTLAADVITFITAGEDAPLRSLPDYSRREIIYLAEQEQVVHLEDFLMRRSLIAMRGMIKTAPDCVEEIAHILAPVLGWNAAQTGDEIARTWEMLESKHGLKKTSSLIPEKL
jgi:glycerol-3-phosphate dehydrogenase